MTDLIDFGTEPWQAIPRRVLRDSRLSARAKGGLVTLLSHEEGWVRSCIAVLQRECRCGAKQAQAIMHELRDLGYAELITERKNNRISKHYVVTAIPKGEGSGAVSTALLTSTFSDGHVSDLSVQGAVVVKALDVEPLDEEPKTEELAPRKRDAIWDVLVEMYGEPTGSGRGARNAAVKVLRDYGADPDEIRAFVAVLAQTDRDWAVTTPSALAKHYGERRALVAQVQNGRKKHDHAAQLLREALGE